MKPSKQKLKLMSERLANILEQPVFEIYPQFLKAVEIDKQVADGNLVLTTKNHIGKHLR